MKETRVRYAPSPTGDPHVGNLRSAIFNWLHAKNQNGKFILRIEDTDQSRMVKDGIQKQKDALTWLGMKWDEIYIQSERLDIYSKYSQILIDEDKAYRCFATAEELDELRERQKQERLDQVQAFASSGSTQTKAARELGVSLQTLNRFIQLNSIRWLVKEQGKRS